MTAVEGLGSRKQPRLVRVKGSVLLKDEYERSKRIRLSDFPDRTGYECFLNHVHLPYDGSRAALQGCLKYIGALRKALLKFADNSTFGIIVSVADDSCVVRFHELRPNEEWLLADVERYPDEAVLTMTVGKNGSRLV